MTPFTGDPFVVQTLTWRRLTTVPAKRKQIGATTAATTSLMYTTGRAALHDPAVSPYAATSRALRLRPMTTTSSVIANDNGRNHSKPFGPPRMSFAVSHRSTATAAAGTALAATSSSQPRRDRFVHWLTSHLGEALTPFSTR